MFYLALDQALQTTGYAIFEDTQKQANLDTYKRLCYVQSVIML